MLLEVIKEGEIVSVRLSTGEELVAVLKKDDMDSKGSMKLSKPLIVGRSESGFGLMPYMMTVSPESTTLMQQDIVVHSDSGEQTAIAT